MAAASLTAERGLWDTWASVAAPRGLPGLVAPRHVGSSQIEPMSPALAGGFFATEPPGKPPTWILIQEEEESNSKEGSLKYC